MRADNDSRAASSHIRNDSFSRATLVYSSGFIALGRGLWYLVGKMLVLRRMLLFFLPFAATMAQSSITATTPVVSMLGMIPECSVSILDFALDQSG